MITEAQKKAGNYPKGHTHVLGIRASIETKAGEERSGTDHEGKEWKQTLQHDYGYLRGTTGKDKDHIDAFFGPGDPAKHPVHVVDQLDHEGNFDEHKVMLGFKDADEASDAYHANYEPGWRGMGDVTAMDHGDFKKWALAPGRRVKPAAEHSVSKGYADGGLVTSAGGAAFGNPNLTRQGRRDGAAPERMSDYQDVHNPVTAALAGFMGTAPDELAGSVLDPNYQRNKAAAVLPYVLGTAAQLPLFKGAQGAGKVARGALEQLGKSMVVARPAYVPNAQLGAIKLIARQHAGDFESLRAEGMAKGGTVQPAMLRLTDVLTPQEVRKVKATGHPVPEFVTPQEAQALRAAFTKLSDRALPQGYQVGGLVKLAKATKEFLESEKLWSNKLVGIPGTAANAKAIPGVLDHFIKTRGLDPSTEELLVSGSPHPFDPTLSHPVWALPPSQSSGVYGYARGDAHPGEPLSKNAAFRLYTADPKKRFDLDGNDFNATEHGIDAKDGYPFLTSKDYTLFKGISDLSLDPSAYERARKVKTNTNVPYIGSRILQDQYNIPYPYWSRKNDAIEPVTGYASGGLVTPEQGNGMTQPAQGGGLSGGVAPLQMQGMNGLRMGSLNGPTQSSIYNDPSQGQGALGQTYRQGTGGQGTDMMGRVVERGVEGQLVGAGLSAAGASAAVPYAGSIVSALNGDYRSAAWSAGGAAIGSIIPGVGTVIGGIVGSLLGSIFS